MPMEDTDILIIGGGLSGLYAAYLLSQQKKSFTLLEARSRVGGRILSTEYKGYFSDMGPSWYWPEINPKWVRLVQTLGLEGHRQFEIGPGVYHDACLLADFRRDGVHGEKAVGIYS